MGADKELYTRVETKPEDDISVAVVPEHSTCLSKFSKRVRNAWDLRAVVTGLFNPKASASQLQVLDVVRTFAVTWVICHHAFIYLTDHAVDPMFGELSTSWAMRFSRNGDLGVDIFFVLSGFLISYTLMREYASNGKIGLPRFYARRWLRIFPAMGVLLAIFWPALSSLDCQLCSACNKTGWMQLLFINNFATAIDQCLPWTWSVAMEMQLYLISPFIILLYSRFRKTGIAVTFALLAATMTARGVYFGVNGLYLPGRDELTFLDSEFKPYFRGAAYFIGMLLAYAYEDLQQTAELKERRYSTSGIVVRVCLVLAALFVVSLVVVFGSGYPTPLADPASFAYLFLFRCAVAVAFATIIYLALEHSVLSSVPSLFARVCGWRVWYIFAQLAYGAFLFHPPWMFLFNLAFRGVQLNYGWMFLITIADILGANLLSLVVYVLVEKPIMNLRV